MACLYIDRKGVTLTIANKALVVNDQYGKVTSVPLGLLDRICIKGDIMLSASVLGGLGEQDIAVLVLRGLTYKPTMLLPSIRQDAKRRVLQATLGSHKSFCLSFSKGIIQKKLEMQYATILSYKDDLATIDYGLGMTIEEHQKILIQIADSASSAVLLGIEGNAARQYFKLIAQILPASLNFNGRNRRPPKDPFNVVLSLGYTLLHHEWVRHIYLMGLDPFIGFYHTVFFGRESLASDLLEPIRPIYDAWAIGLFKSGILRVEDFTMNGVACKMGKAGRLRFYEAYEEWLAEQQCSFYKIKQWLFSAIREEAAINTKQSIFEESDNVFSQDSLKMIKV